MRRSYTVYDITFKDGARLTVSEKDGFRNQLDVYNWVCRAGNAKLRSHGGVEKIDCRPMHE